jgi:diguanylate cyclase (GGDEF)-like protein
MSTEPMGLVEDRTAPRSEAEQSFVRVVLVMVFSVYLTIEATFGGDLASVMPLVPVMILYWLFALTHVAWTRLSDHPSSELRRILSMTVDLGLCALMMSVSGKIFAPFLCMPVWIVIGSGLRFGGRYFYIGSIVGAIFTLAAVITSPFWRELPTMALGVVASVIFLPIYAHVLTQHLQRARQELAQRAAHFEAAAHIEPLTGLLNRRALLQELERIMTVDAQSKGGGALMLIDLDGFKGVNDKGGHAQGDAFLRKVAARLRALVRSEDHVARIGGDEFAVLIPGVPDEDSAERIAESIVAGVSALPTEQRVRVGASIGVLILPDPRASTPEDALLLADSLMYEVKRNGKGSYRVSIPGNVIALPTR